MSHQYRAWRDFLLQSLDDYMPADDLWHLLDTAHMVGLFTCIFVKSTIRDRIKNLKTSEVKRGMGGVYGNKVSLSVGDYGMEWRLTCTGRRDDPVHD